MRALERAKQARSFFRVRVVGLGFRCKTVLSRRYLLSMGAGALAAPFINRNHFRLFAGAPEAAWDQASELSREVHITRRPKPFKTVL